MFSYPSVDDLSFSLNIFYIDSSCNESFLLERVLNIKSEYDYEERVPQCGFG